MGGTITLKSEVGKGSVFSLTLPLKYRAGPIAAARIHADGAGSGETVLLSVDDDPSVGPLLQKMLASHGYRVVASTTPALAVSEARDLRPAVILLDILMPERDGHDVLRDLKADPATSRIPVIVVSVVDRADMPGQADGHVSKPVNTDRLLAVLAEHGAAPKRALVEDR